MLVVTKAAVFVKLHFDYKKPPEMRFLEPSLIR